MNDKRLAGERTGARPSLAESIKIFGKAIKVSIKARGYMSVIISLVGFAMAFLPLLISLVIRRFSDDVQALFAKGSGSVGSVIGVFVMLSALYVIQLLWASLRNYMDARDENKIQQFMRERVLRCSCEVKYKYIDNFDDFRQRIDFVNSTAGRRVASSMGMTITWLQNIITFISVVIVLWSIDYRIVLILVATAAPAVVLTYFFSEEEYTNKGFWILEYLMASCYFFEATRDYAVNDVRFFGAYSWLRRKFDAMNKQYITVKNKVTRKHVFFNSLADIFRGCVYVFILLIVARQIFDNPAVGIGSFMLVFTMAGQLQEVSTNIFGAAAQFISDAAYMRDFFYLDELDHELRNENAVARESYFVDFNNVSFTYPETEREILHNINVHIREGEKIAIVGENGSGKTTFISLLCALYEPDSGEIKMGGKNIYEDLSTTRRTLSALFQDFPRYETSIRENIVVSDNNRNATDEEICTLAEKIAVRDVIAEQPGGLDEVVGSFSPTGNNLSGGQWQKIALLRCAYREDAKIMVLDEPTAALDPLAEAELYRNFTDITGDRTTILISHRLGITQLVDRILVFDDGRIVEEGTHLDLLSRGGLYTKMYQAQAHWYK